MPAQIAKPRDAAAVILFRRTGGEAEVFWLKREKNLTFAGGFYAFPGGKVDAADANIPVEGATGPDAAIKVAAARELFEETGVLVASGAEKLEKPKLDELRKGLLEKKLTFRQMVEEHKLQLRAADFKDAGRWVTPPFLPVRFDARFFLVEAPRNAQAEFWPGELAEGAWVKPKDALARWGAGTALLHPPNQYALETMVAFSTVDAALQRLQNPPHCPNHVATRIEFQKGIRIFPLETATLPPATHTNAYVLGNGELLIVDPGATEVRQYARLLALVAGFKAEGKRVKAIFLTHHHGDHIGGAQAVAERLNAPVWCHEKTADRLPFKVGRLLKDGDEIQLAGLPAMTFQVLHTPGHARGHLCLVEKNSRAAIVGDMVAGVGTIVIDPPEGDMTDYLAQLARLRDLPVAAIYPSHGPVIPDGVSKLNEYIRHREVREQKVLDAIPKSGATIQDIVAKAYSDTPEFLHPIAERSAQASLIKLVREAKVKRDGDRYTRSDA